MKKLFKVSIELEIDEPFLAEDEKEAIRLAEENATKIIEDRWNPPFTFYAREIKTLEDLPREYEGTFPYSYNNQEVRTCEEILGEMDKVAEEIKKKNLQKKIQDEKQLKLPFAEE